MSSDDRSGRLLSDEQLQEFIRSGYVTVHTALPEEFHASVCRQAEELLGTEPNPGNNLLPRIPDLATMLTDPAVHGALTSILGSGYLLDDHRYCHDNRPGSKPQNMHQDGGSQGDHRTRKVLLLYYPQDTPEPRGPTGVLPGSQYYDRCPEGTAVKKVTGRAGTVTITHYELWHGATANRTERPRYMMKFLLHRMQEPEAPSWDAAVADWDTDSALRQAMWRWHRGAADDAAPDAGAAHGTGAADLEALADPDQQRGLEAAYALAACANGNGAALAGRLCEALAGDCAVTAARAMYALAALGPAAVPALSEALANRDAAARARVAQALAEMGGATAAAGPALRQALRDGDGRVRTWAASALGTGCGAEAEESIVALAAAIDDDMPDRGYRRQTSAHAIARLAGTVEAGAADRVARLLAPHLASGNRYVRGLTAAALRRLGSPAATELLLDWLTVGRWCPITTPDSPY
ncbi:MAG: HEAT repeat domain-containing protein [Spirochaetaceae bacterium]|nr:HEAT repeat domain-containing protein [Spirochaetaceae bacterium]